MGGRTNTITKWSVSWVRYGWLWWLWMAMVWTMTTTTTTTQWSSWPIGHGAGTVPCHPGPTPHPRHPTRLPHRLGAESQHGRVLGLGRPTGGSVWMAATPAEVIHQLIQPTSPQLIQLIGWISWNQLVLRYNTHPTNRSN